MTIRRVDCMEQNHPANTIQVIVNIIKATRQPIMQPRLAASRLHYYTISHFFLLW